VKQLDQDPLSGFLADHPKGSIVKGTVTEVDARGAILSLEGGMQGQLRASELSRDRVEDARTVLSVGDEIEARFVSMDRKSRVISLSIKAKEAREEADAVQSYQTSDAGPVSSGTTLGDLLKEQMGGEDGS
ncbi:MAG: S1 RNA-binding domain-containing protein, partial [Xanthomonadales bacterium]|nr:S1 RNA-binding domain-containing protein [Xanthomonadales bacterium]